MRNTTLWIPLAVVSSCALLAAFFDARSTTKAKSKPALAVRDQARASGFTIKGDVAFEKDLRNGMMRLKSSVWASGPMSKSEVIMFEGFSTLITPNKTKRAFGPIRTTFKDRMESIIAVEGVTPGSVVRIQGTVRVFRRETIKVERQLLSDGALCLYLNTGTVVFRKLKGSFPPQMEVLCEKLQSVHDHGMELLAKDRKTVSARILLSPGRQLIERETYPYLTVVTKMEPVFIWQLIPKRSEPLDITLAVPSNPTIRR